MTNSGASPAHWRVDPTRELSGTITVPGDKSISHRSLMLGGIASGTTEVTGFLASEDCLATLTALRSLGAVVEQRAPDHLLVRGVGARGLRAPAGPLDMGNAGTAMRLFMGLLSGQGFDSTLIGDSSLMRRPMERVARPLRAMGAVIETLEGRPPVVIRGGQQLHAIDFQMPVASAQVKSALLLAALGAEGRTRITEPAPTRDHTERMLGGFGVEVLRQGNSVLIEGGQRLGATRIEVPGDFSSAAFFIVAASLGEGPGLRLLNVGINPTRTGLLDMLLSMGADIRVHRRQDSAGPEPVADLEIRPARLRGLRVAEGLVPLAIDEFPVFFIAAACAEGDTLVRGAQELRVKESDRLAVMAEGLAALGVEHELLDDGMWIRGKGSGDAFQSGSIDSHGDHRVAMSFAVASLRAAGPIQVRDTANVATSFPGFAGLARHCGLKLVEL